MVAVLFSEFVKLYDSKSGILNILMVDGRSK
jgi:hypothetical protein